MINETKGVILDNQNNVSYGSLPLPQLENDEILVKVHSAPLNPSDLEFLKGHYPTKKPKPTFAGFEGSGLVVSTGSDEKVKGLLNQKVTFSGSGAFAEHIILKGQQAFQIPGDLSYEEASSCFVNPLSAQAMIQISLNQGHKTIIHSAAASSLGKMLVVGCKQAEIDIICIVRKEEQAQILRELGVEHILNSSDPAFESLLEEKVKEMNPTIFFDPVAGEVGSQILTKMPPGTTTYCYGSLSNKDYTVGASELIFKNKSLKGFWLTNILSDSKLRTQVFTSTFNNLATRAYKTDIAQRYPQEKYEDAIAYYKSNMTEGKVILQNPNF